MITAVHITEVISAGIINSRDSLVYKEPAECVYSTQLRPLKIPIIDSSRNPSNLFYVEV